MASDAASSDASHSPLMVGWTTVDNLAVAKQLAEGLVTSGLAACVQIDGPVESWYQWQGSLETTTEFRLWVKFPAALADNLTTWLSREHPYECPQWVALPATSTLPAYLNWVNQSTKASANHAQ